MINSMMEFAANFRKNDVETGEFFEFFKLENSLTAKAL
jgi:hypothetical protein